MQDLNGNTLFSSDARFALAAPIILLDQDKPAPKGDGKGKDKPKAAPNPDRKLSDFEMEAIKRIAKIDPNLGRKLAEKLPKKKTSKAIRAYLEKRIGKLDVERDRITKFANGPLGNKKGLKKALERIDKLEKELGHLRAFHTFGTLPNWYKKLLEDRKKKQQKKNNKAPTSKPAGPSSGSRPSGTFRLPDGLILTLVAA